MTFTVIIRDINPYIHMRESCTHRSVQIELTEAQIEKIGLRQIQNNPPLFEEITAIYLGEY